MRRILLLLVGMYVTAALVGRALEAAGLNQCGCAPDCWCKRPGLSVFRWVFPRGHRGMSPEVKRLADR